MTFDLTILLTGTKANEDPLPLCRVRYRKQEKTRRLSPTILTWQRKPKLISLQITGRWSCYTQWLKQNLKIKTFRRNSLTAVMDQLRFARITMLVLSSMMFLARLGQSLPRIQRLQKFNLYNRPVLWTFFQFSFYKTGSPKWQKMLFACSSSN